MSNLDTYCIVAMIYFRFIHSSYFQTYIPKDLPLGFLGQLLALRDFGVQPEVTTTSGVGEFGLCWLNSEGL